MKIAHAKLHLALQKEHVPRYVFFFYARLAGALFLFDWVVRSGALPQLFACRKDLPAARLRLINQPLGASPRFFEMKLTARTASERSSADQYRIEIK